MLPVITKETNNLLKDYKKAQDQHNARTDISNTKNELARLKRNCDEIVSSMVILISKDCLEFEQRIGLISKIENIVNQLEYSKERFSREEKPIFQQASEVDDIHAKVMSLKENIRGTWMIHVQKETASHKELKKLAVRLPSMKSSIPRLDTLEKSIESLSQKLPNLNVWNEYNLSFTEFRTILGEIEGLSEDKRNFLDKVIASEATIQDITPELLEWCNEMQLSESLLVRFPDGR